MLNGNTDPIALSLFLGALSLIPLIIVTTTSFLKVSIVLLVTRNALGVQQVPPTMAIYGIALAASAFIMTPTLQQMAQRVMKPENNITEVQLNQNMLKKAADVFEPLQGFMLKYSKPEQRDIFLSTAKQLWPKDMADKAMPTDALILIPSFVVSEIQAAFEISFLIYIPFVAIDLLISNLLMALGMQQVSPQTITIPLKLLLFVLVDGWGKLVNALAMSYM